jgi:hypothetical protein
MRLRPARSVFHLILPFIFLLLAASSAGAQSADPVLAGLKGVELGMELQNDTEARLGLTADRAYAAVEEELRKAGVRFLPAPAQRMEVGSRIQRMPKGYALLFFQVATVADEKLGGYAVDLSFQLLDRVRLTRDSSKETAASIYKGRHLILMSGRGSAEEAERRLRALAREFAADFKASNPAETQNPRANKR